MIAIFFIGIYGGFIQVGAGFMIIAALTTITGFNLVVTNSHKVFYCRYLYDLCFNCVCIQWQCMLDDWIVPGCRNGPWWLDWEPLGGY